MMADRQIKLAFLAWIALWLLIVASAVPWRDMWALYGEAIRSMVPRPYGRVRQG